MPVGVGAGAASGASGEGVGGPDDSPVTVGPARVLVASPRAVPHPATSSAVAVSSEVSHGVVTV